MFFGIAITFLLGCIAEVGERDNPYDEKADLTDFERDTYYFGEGSDGIAKRGLLSNECYVFEDNEWRLGNNNDCSWGGCTKKRQNFLIDVGKWYICDKLSWREATNIEVDTVSFGNNYQLGDMKNGRINKNVSYTFENNTWRYATELETIFQFSCTTKNKDTVIQSPNSLWYKCTADGWIFDIEKNSRIMTDSRDNKEYKTITIGGQTWIVENLNFLIYESKCYEYNQENCSKFGRLYTWNSAKYACPDKWHLPQKDELDALKDYYTIALKRTFNEEASFWSSSQDGVKNGYYIVINDDYSILWNTIAKNTYLPVR